MPAHKGARRRARWLGALAVFTILCALMAGALWRPGDISADRLRAVPLLLQRDYKRTIVTIGGKARTVHSSGCGAVCMSMAIGYLRPDARDADPEALFSWANDKGYYSGNGLGHECLTAMAKRWSIRSEWVGREAAARVVSALRQGKPVIAHVGPGEFTRNGHYILLRGVDEAGRILVNDPASAARSGRAYEQSLIFSQLKTAQGLMILTP